MHRGVWSALQQEPCATREASARRFLLDGCKSRHRELLHSHAVLERRGVEAQQPLPDLVLLQPHVHLLDARLIPHKLCHSDAVQLSETGSTTDPEGAAIVRRRTPQSLRRFRPTSAGNRKRRTPRSAWAASSSRPCAARLTPRGFNRRMQRLTPHGNHQYAIQMPAERSRCLRVSPE